MKRNKLLLIILILLLVISGDGARSVSALQRISLCGSQSEIPKIECDALVALYNSTNGDSWTTNTGWKAIPYTPCSWFGVTCASGHVTQFYLPSNNLAGNIPSELSNLSHLDYIDFDSNHLTGSIPPELGNLLNFSVLALYNNPLTGPIPASFTNLESLNLFWFHNTDLCEPQDTAFQSWLTGVSDVKSNGVACYVAPTATATMVPPTKTVVPPTAAPTLVLPTETALPPTETAVPEAIQEADTEDETGNEEQEAMILEPAAAEDGEDDQLGDLKIILIALVGLMAGILIMLVIFVLLYKKK